MTEVGEERAALFSRSGRERIDQLEAKRKSYEELAEKLFTLPQKLRHPGLIPVGPRLFLPGSLVRTNEVTVLLGSCGDASYFAERSAHQALGIVQRRLAIVDSKLADIDVGKKELHDAVEQQEKRGRSTSKTAAKSASAHNVVNATATSAAKDVSIDTLPPSSPVAEESTKKAKKRVSFHDPLVVGPGLLKADKPKSGTVVGVTKPPKPIAPVAGKSRTGPVRQDMPNDNNYKSQELQAAESRPSSTQAASSSMAKKEAPKEVLSQFETAVQAAQRQVAEDSVVNITEVYTDDSEDPTRVELPQGFEPDKNISFEDGSEDYLDVTGNKSKADEVPVTREDYWRALIEAEAEEEAQQAEEESRERNQALVREKKEFGAGLAKGFFGAPPVKTAKVKADTPVHGETITATSSNIGEEPVAVQEKIVERRPSRRKSKTSRKARHSSMEISSSMPSAHKLNDSSMEGGSGSSALERIVETPDDIEDSDLTPISKFRQLRKQQKATVGK